MNRKAWTYTGLLFVTAFALTWFLNATPVMGEEEPPVTIQYKNNTYVSSDFYYQTDGHPTGELSATGDVAGKEAGVLAGGRILKHQVTGDLYIEHQGIQPTMWLVYKKY